ncbi:MAG: hypothetical protein AAFN74_04695 [Myxococcota bacterium]
MPQLYAGLLFLAAGAQSSAVSQELVESARKAQRNGEVAVVRRLMRGWASLRSRTELPQGLTEPGARAVSFIEAEGRLHLFGTWRDDVVSVGVHDPAGIVDRIEVWAEADTERIRIPRYQEKRSSRAIYRVDSGRTQAVIVQAIFLNEGRSLVLAETRLRPQAIALPAAPDPDALAQKLNPTPKTAETVRVSVPVLRWWWIAAGIVALGLTGVAVANEL